MSNLLLIEKKLYNNTVTTVCKKKDCEIIIIKKNLQKILSRKKVVYKKVILISERILTRSSEAYRDIKKYLNKKDVFFIEISYEKSKISKDRAVSDAIINGSSINTNGILKKLLVKQ